MLVALVSGARQLGPADQGPGRLGPGRLDPRRLRPGMIRSSEDLVPGRFFLPHFGKCGKSIGIPVATENGLSSPFPKCGENY